MTLTERINDLFARFNVKLEATEVEVQLEAQAVLENGTIIYTDADDFAEGADVFIINEEGERIPLPQGDYNLQDGSKMSIAEGGKVSVAPNKGKGKDGAEGKDGGDGKAKPANPAKSKDVVKDSGDAPKAPAKPAAKPAPKPNPPKKVKKSEQEKLAEATEEVVTEQEVLEEEEKEEVMQEVFVTEEEVRALINQILDERMADNDEDSVEAEKKDEEEMEEEKEEMQTEVSEDQQELSEVDKLKAEITELKSQAASEGVKRVVKTEPKPEPVNLSELTTEQRIKALYNQFNK